MKTFKTGVYFICAHPSMNEYDRRVLARTFDHNPTNPIGFAYNMVKTENPLLMPKDTMPVMFTDLKLAVEWAEINRELLVTTCQSLCLDPNTLSISAEVHEIEHELFGQIKESVTVISAKCEDGSTIYAASNGDDLPPFWRKGIYPDEEEVLMFKSSEEAQEWLYKDNHLKRLAEYHSIYNFIHVNTSDLNRKQLEDIVSSTVKTMEDAGTRCTVQ